MSGTIQAAMQQNTTTHCASIEMQYKSAVQSSKEIRTLSLFYFQHFLRIAIRILIETPSTPPLTKALEK